MRDEIDEVVVNQLAAAEVGTEDALDPTLVSLRNDLANIQALLREPKPVDSLDDETEIRKIVAALVAMPKPTNAAPQPPSVTEQEPHEPHASHEPHGDLGQYQLLAVIGRGGMGAVYKARHRKLDKIVAVKVLPPGKLKDPQAIARFEREMRAVGKLQHPHIVAAHDAGEIDGTHYLVMELVDGVDLAALVKMHGPLPISAACELIRQAALGLQHASEQGLVHRDIKPSNLILAKSQRGLPPLVKVLDMGLALLDDVTPESGEELTSTGQVMGTIDYMAPEQSHNTHKVDIRADIYSLGATLYKLLTGRAPFADAQYDSVIKKLMALATQPIPDIRALRPDCPAKLAAIVNKLLAKNPADRPSLPSEVADSVTPFAAGATLSTLFVVTRSAGDDAHSLSDTDISVTSLLPTVVESTSIVPQTFHFGMTRSRWLATAIGLGLLLLAAGGFLITKEPAASALPLNSTGNLLGKQIERPPQEQGAGLLNIRQTPLGATRAAAEWVLSVGGKLTLEIDRVKLMEIHRDADLPSGQLTLDVVNLSSCKGITADGMAVLAQAPWIRDLWLTGSNLTDETLAAISPLKEVFILRLDSTAITDEGLCRFVSNQKRLRELSLRHVPLTAKSLTKLFENCPDLQLLECPDLVYDESFRQAMTHANSLTGIQLSAALLQPAIVESLFQSAPMLTELKVSRTIDAEHILALEKVPSLRTLWFENDAVITTGALQMLTKLKKLQTLGLRIPLSRSQLADLASTNLSCVRIYYPEGFQTNLDELANCQSLKLPIAQIA